MGIEITDPNVVWPLNRPTSAMTLEAHHKLDKLFQVLGYGTKWSSDPEENRRKGAGELPGVAHWGAGTARHSRCYL